MRYMAATIPNKSQTSTSQAISDAAKMAALNLPQGMDTVLWGRFKLRDLTKTSQASSNIPNNLELRNLRNLAIMLTKIEEEFGPIRVLSAFRTAEVQNRLKARDVASGTAYAATKKSFHEAGMAADIAPGPGSKFRDVNELWAAMVLTPWVQKEFSEFAIKPEEGQMTIHLSLSAPGLTFKPMIADNSGYHSLTMAQVKERAASYLSQAVETVKKAASSAKEAVASKTAVVRKTVSENKKPILMGVALVGAAALLWYFYVREEE
jgi:hypothetical protein